MTSRISLLCTLAFCLAFGVGCNSNVFVPHNSTVQYENNFTHTIVSVPQPLSSEIVSVLNDEPAEARQNASMGLDTRKYIRICERTFQVKRNELVLLDSWGYRNWKLNDIESKLDGILANATTK